MADDKKVQEKPTEGANKMAQATDAQNRQNTPGATNDNVAGHPAGFPVNRTNLPSAVNQNRPGAVNNDVAGHPAGFPVQGTVAGPLKTGTSEDTAKKDYNTKDASFKDAAYQSGGRVDGKADTVDADKNQKVEGNKDGAVKAAVPAAPVGGGAVQDEKVKSAAQKKEVEHADKKNQEDGEDESLRGGGGHHHHDHHKNKEVGGEAKSENKEDEAKVEKEDKAAKEDEKKKLKEQKKKADEDKKALEEKLHKDSPALFPGEDADSKLAEEGGDEEEDVEVPDDLPKDAEEAFKAGHKAAKEQLGFGEPQEPAVDDEGQQLDEEGRVHCNIHPQALISPNQECPDCNADKLGGRTARADLPKYHTDESGQAVATESGRKSTKKK